MAEPEIPSEIKAQSTDRLLTLFANLTHKIHGSRVTADTSDLRAQRDVVKREIIYRCDRIR